VVDFKGKKRRGEKRGKNSTNNAGSFFKEMERRPS